MSRSLTAVLESATARLQASCRSWREVRQLARTWKPWGYLLVKVRRTKRREDWSGTRGWLRGIR